jgi:DNA helicase-2/ATP-dependent DNA helicase PcrA
VRAKIPRMSFVADLHIHSKYSRACSRDCDLEHLAWWAQRKGIALVGTGDFTHPAWYEHLRDTLVPDGPGTFRLNDELDRAVTERVPASCRAPVRFMLSVEISTIYKRGDRTRKVHHLIYMPDLDAVARFNARLGRIGNITSDGRPILGLDSRDLLEITLEASPDAYLIPAHVWTPWFAVLGSKSGFDRVADCYDDLAGHIFAVETGLSSDPEMNWRVSSLDQYTLVSNSDAHSPPMLGREATIFDTEPDYPSVRRALETREGFGGTIEFFPEEGKYHADGHRKCGVRLDPAATRELDGRCPGCGGPLTVGVLHRVEALADRPPGQRPEGAAPVRSLVQLPEILGEIAGVGSKSRSVARELDALTAKLGPELAILSDLPIGTIAEAASEPLVEAIRRLRRGQVIRDAGYDGEYGVIRLFAPDELKELSGSVALFEPPPPVAAPKREPAPSPAPARAAAPAAAPAVVPDTGLDSLPAGSPLRALDPEQRAAASVAGRPVLIIAGPGTGKTRTLTTRIAHLVAERGVRPEQCLAITFTRRAAGELRERLGALLPDGAGARVEVATFHSLGLAIVRERHEALGLGADVRVADEAERLAVAAGDLGAGSRRDAAKLVADLSARKRAQAMVPAAARQPDEALDRWDAALRARGLVDFDDLVALPVALLEADPALAEAYRARWPYLSVDEYQDVDALQYRLLRLLAGADGELCVIGDPDQAIYGFRGADVGFFLRFERDFPSAAVVQLTRNYRSTPAVVEGALAAIAPATLVPGRSLTPVAAPAGVGRIAIHRAASEAAEAELVARTIEELIGGSSFHSLDTGRSGGTGEAGLGFGDVAVLYRTDAQSGPIAEALGRAGVPFQKRSHDRVADRPGVAAIVAELRAGVAAPEGATVLTLVRLAGRTAAVAAAEAGGTEQEAGRLAAEVMAAVDLLAPLAGRCEDLAGFLDELALGAEVDTLDPRAERIALLTLHAAKGLEFPVVFLVGCEDGLLPLRWSGAAGSERGDLDEERRLLFVGMTRARSHLYLSSAARRLRHGVVREAAPSPFLDDIGADLLEAVTLGEGRRAAAAPGDQLRLL